ncbi:LysR family transcriptional regulator [Roseobacter sp. HKCCD8485]|uniref:LysR family transcriptional regulator n=1 Tax=Roseobacter sp. HKCCD8485 TaxID=2690547 RepID=UPI0014913600|nr:LysR family transcriptional regulator [Roseobacter sp. HKCCD8485]NOB38733.1 LysR family transcriptional regulator [Roseobacter sp. HKCCD8485]
METQPHWDDYAYFAAVARHGGIARAAEASGVSTATLSRRMRAFETRLGRRLFLHGSAGYALTSDGRQLYEKAQKMEVAATEIARWHTEATGPVCVRISAGSWTATDLAEHASAYWSPNATWLPEFVYCDLSLDIARREVDIGIRNTRPDQPWLAGQQIGHVDYAAYATSPEVVGWIGPAHGSVETPSAQWIKRHHSPEIVTKANTPHLAVALARAGIGRVVLPLLIGERMNGLTRVSDPIAELRSEQWLVSHHEGRHEKPVRAALDAIAGYLRQRDPLP